MAPQDRYGRFLSGEDKKKINYKVLSKKEILHIKKYLNEVYGIESDVLDDFLFLKRSDDVWVSSYKATTIMDYEKKGLNINVIGIRAIRNSFTKLPKITTNFAQLIGKYIKKNKIDLSFDEFVKYIHGYDLELKENTGLKGYCILFYKGDVVGVGLVKNNVIKNQIPKGRVLKDII